MFFQANCVNRKLVFHKKQEYVLIMFLFLDYFKSFHDLLHLSFILLIVDYFSVLLLLLLLPIILMEFEQLMTRNRLLKRKEVVIILDKKRI